MQIGSGQNVKLAPGEYLLTPLQVLLINKMLRAGFKIELEDQYLKSTGTSHNFVGKKRKHVSHLN